MEVQIAAPQGAVKGSFGPRPTGLISRHAQIRLEGRTLLAAHDLQNLLDRGLVLDICPTRNACGLSVVYDLQHREFVALIRSMMTGQVVTALSMADVAGSSLGISLWRAADNLARLAERTGEKLYDIDFATDGSWARVTFTAIGYFIDTTAPLSPRRSRKLTTLRRDQIDFPRGTRDARIGEPEAARQLAELAERKAAEHGPSFRPCELMILDKGRRLHALTPPSDLALFDVATAARTHRWHDPMPGIQ
jgi:hypothetical protein